MSNARDKANIPALNFSSTGIDDNATSTAMTISSGGVVSMGTTSSSGGWQVKVAGSNAPLELARTTGDTNERSHLGMEREGTFVGQFKSDATNLWLEASAGALIINTGGGSERMRIDSSGNVGIGDTSPNAKLDVRSQINVTNANGHSLQAVTGTRYGYSSAYKVVLLGGSGATTADNIAIGYDPSVNSSGAFTGTGNELLFKNGIKFTTPNSTDTGFNTNHLVLKDGNVGIGTSSPNEKLQVHFPSSGSSFLQLTNTDTGSNDDNGLYVGVISGGNSYISNRHSGNDIIFQNDNTEVMRIKTGGNIGIGASNPSSTLHISGDPQVTLTQPNNLVLQNDTDSATSGDAKTGILFRANYNGTTATDLANITAGKENATNNNYGSFISFHTRTNGVNELREALSISSIRRFHTNGTTSPGGQLNLVGERGANYRAIIFEHTNQGGEVGNITTGSSSVSYNTSSDYRLKENVVDMTNATDRLKQLQPKRFNFITDADTTVDGFLAHEVSSIVPEAISGEKDAVDEDGNPEYQGIDQSKLVPLLVKTIQELEARITTLEANNP
jgi:hypothetical protein